MQFLMTAISVIGGMAFSLAFAILVEEFIFGKVLVVRLCPASGTS